MQYIKIKRIYEDWEDTDGFRILVDRLWPRGVKKESAHVDLWLKEISPSTELRKWFGHDPKKWPEFEKKYIAEIKANKEAVNKLLETVKAHNKVMLVYGAKDEGHNQAVVLHSWLTKK